ncbi:hypothetical protein ABKN59_006202 [Abortiporus biennis]
MVSADNINLDCLGAICAYLSGPDLVAVSLTSRSFLVAATPHLYRTIGCNSIHSVQYKYLSLFETIQRHPQLALHVREIDLQVFKLVGTIRKQFLKSCRNTIENSIGLESFSCESSEFLDYLLPSLKKLRQLRTIRISGNLEDNPAQHLLCLTGLREISLNSASWNVTDQLPKWIRSGNSTLTTLCLFQLESLNEGILKDVLQTSQYTPNIKSLGLSCLKMSSNSLVDSNFTFSDIQHLAVQFWEINTFMTENVSFLNLLLKLLVGSHRSSLRTLAIEGLSRAVMDIDRLSFIARDCRKLEKLTIPISISKRSEPLGVALSSSATLRTFKDSALRNVMVKNQEIIHIMNTVPSLETIEENHRVWTRNIRYPSSSPRSKGNNWYRNPIE